MGLQSLHQVDDFDVVILVVAALREIDQLLTLQSRSLLPFQILALQLGALVRVEHIKEFLNLVLII